MRALRAFGRYFWRFMVIFSFIVNIVLVVVLLILGILIFEIKNEVAQPLVSGLHSSFVGLDNATIDWTIPVRDEIQVVLDIPLETDTVVVLNEPVPLQVNALIDLPGINAYNVNAAVNLELPVGLELPVALDLDVAVDQPLPVELDVRAVIPLQETQLHDVAQNLRLQLEPLAFALHNLPDDFGGAAEMVGDVLRGDAPNLLAVEGCDYCQNPWPGYSRTAGLDYDLFDVPMPEQNQPMVTGIVPSGGMPLLDQEIRPVLWEGDNTPEQNNLTAYDLLAQSGVPAYTYNGSVSAYRAAALAAALEENAEQPDSGDAGVVSGEDNAGAENTATGGPDVVVPPDDDTGEDLGIIPPSD